MTTEDKPQPRVSVGHDAPRARTLFRQGAVYGLAGAMKAADVAVAAARGAVRGAREGVATAEREPPTDSA
ncbi:MAG: hypothetical protein JO304_09865 [Solirubrobacterales bacterium]|nr:hypothetical protein [Solirubrobacterales bacterium]